MPAVNPTSDELDPSITIASPVVFDNVIVLLPFNDALIPETDWLMLVTKPSYEVANSTVSVLIVKVALILKVPFWTDWTLLKASALAPWTPEFTLIASANVLASFVVEPVKSEEKSAANAFWPLIFISAAAIILPPKPKFFSVILSLDNVWTPTEPAKPNERVSDFCRFTSRASSALIPIWKLTLSEEPSSSFTPLKCVFLAILSISAVKAVTSDCIIVLSLSLNVLLPACTASSRTRWSMFSTSLRAPSAVCVIEIAS